MRISDVYGPVRSKPAPKPEPEQKTQSLEAASMLCRKGINIYLNHSWGPKWICRRCGQQLDTKELFKR